jgi:hypothetical protein
MRLPPRQTKCDSRCPGARIQCFQVLSLQHRTGVDGENSMVDHLLNSTLSLSLDIYETIPNERKCAVQSWMPRFDVFVCSCLLGG